MQNLLGKMADLMSSLLTGSPPAAPASGKTRGDEMKSLVLDCRIHLTDAIHKGKDGTEIIKRLTELDCPLCDKYAVLQVPQLLGSNNQSLEDLKHIIAGLSVIVKYAQHLIRKSDQRREQWRVIHFNNAIVQKKIRPMKGFEIVLQQLGYTLVTANGLSYPSGVEPNEMVIVNLIADMMLFRKEIKEYILGRHPRPQYLQAFIPPETQRELWAAQLSGLKCEDEDMSEASSTQVSYIASVGQMGEQSVLSSVQMGEEPVLSSGQQSYVDTSVIPDAKLMSQPSKTQPECNNNSVADVKLQTVLPISKETTDETTSSDLCASVERESAASQNIKEKPECETEQLQTTVDPAQAIQDPVAATNEQDTVNTESSSGMSSSVRLACTVCGDVATVYCGACANKPLCEGCNKNWHKHPQRQKHNQQCISDLAFMSLESLNPVHIDGAYGISAQTIPSPIRMSQKQQTYLVNQKTLNKKPGIDDKFYSPELPKTFHDSEEAAFFLSSQLKSEQGQHLGKVYSPSDYQRHLNMSSQQQQQHYQQPLQYQHLSAANFDTHSVPYQSYNSPRMVYPGHMPRYLPSQVNPGQQFRSGMDSFSPRISQKQLFDNSELMSSYHNEMEHRQQPNFPYVQHNQAAALQQQQPSGWYFPGMNNRSQNPYPYGQDLAQSQLMGDMGPVSYAPHGIMSNSLFQHTNPNASSDPLFSVSPQRVISTGPSTRNSHLLHHQGTLLQGNMDAHMNMQSTYNPSRGHIFHPAAVDVHQLDMNRVLIPPKHASGMFGGNQNSVHSQTLSMANSFYSQPGIQEPAYQMPRQLSGSSLSSSSSSLGNILSPIFDQLKQVPDVKQRCTKCDEYIAKLVCDIKNLERQINCAMEEDVEICETEQFRSWNKQKALLLQQKKYLEEYRQQLEDETVLMKMNSDEEMSQEIHYPPDIDLSIQTASKKLPVSTTSSDRVPNIAAISENVAVSKASDRRLTVSNINNSASILGDSTPVLKPLRDIRKVEDKSNNTTASNSQVKPASASAKTESNKIVDTNRVSSSKDSQGSRVAVEVSDRKPGGDRISPPAVPQRLPKSGDILSRTFPPPKAVAMSDVQNWHCQHCTFINEASAHVCVMCDKTSDHPLLVGTPDDDSDDDDDNKNGSESENDLLRQDRFLNLLEEIKYTEQKERERDEKLFENEGDDTLSDDQTLVIGPRIRGSQEQVMLEKKKAQQEYMLQQQIEQQTRSRKQSPVVQDSSTPTSQSSVPVPCPTCCPHDFREKHKSSCSLKPEREINYHAGSSDYHTPPSSASPSPPSPHRNTTGQQHKLVQVVQGEGKDDSKKASLGNCDSSLEDTLARFNEISMIDSMQAQGAEFAKLIKMADKEGFDVEAVQIAQSFCENQNMGPVEWLKKNWKKNINLIVNMAITAGNKQQQNSVGEVSEEEAGSAYITCHGNMKDAAQMCVTKRTELYEHLSALGDYPREEILQAMFQCCGKREAAERLLLESKLQPFLDNIWAEKETDARNRFALDLTGPLPEMCHSFSTSIIFHGDFQKMIKDRNVNRDRRIRMIFVEGKLKSWGRAELVIKILDNDLPDDNISLEDVVEAVRNCQDRNSALAYLQQECALCFTNFPMSKIRNLNFCQCRMCEQCLTKNFEIGIREKHVRHWTCPLCSQPDMNDADTASDYLQFLILLLQPLIDKDIQNLFEDKVRDWHLQKDVSFRWCAHCAAGFIAENQGEHLRMTCPNCQEKTCFHCKKQWEPQHEGLTCEQFAQWKIDNDPGNQSVGLAKHLDENGIDCPTCKMRFALAKGGCMHFKCPQCGHEFCSGCNEPFHQKDVCNKYKICKKLGLHCHCPRDCFSYLRDNSVQTLQHLLKMNNVPFNINIPEDQTDPLHCPVMEQKEFDACRKDEKCGKETAKGQAGLCEIHYKEYMVYIINRHGLDPVILMSKEEMTNLLQKFDLHVPKQKPKETPEEYMAHLMQIIQEKLPLRKR